MTFESIITQRIQRSKHAYIYNHLAEYVIRPHNGRTSRNGYGFWEVFLADTINQSRALKGYNRSLEQQHIFFFVSVYSRICYLHWAFPTAMAVTSSTPIQSDSSVSFLRSSPYLTLTSSQLCNASLLQFTSEARSTKITSAAADSFPYALLMHIF